MLDTNCDQSRFIYQRFFLINWVAVVSEKLPENTFSQSQRWDLKHLHKSPRLWGYFTGICWWRADDCQVRVAGTTESVTSSLKYGFNDQSPSRSLSINLLFNWREISAFWKENLKQKQQTAKEKQKKQVFIQRRQWNNLLQHQPLFHFCTEDALTSPSHKMKQIHFFNTRKTYLHTNILWKRCFWVPLGSNSKGPW